MPESIWRQASNADIIGDIKNAVEYLKNKLYEPAPQYVYVSPKVFQALDYCLNTVIIAEWPGYKKKQGPDGKMWFEKRPVLGIDKGRGGGNKANRRMGQVYFDNGWYHCWNQANKQD